ncbi:hypothetical protein [Streptomyces endophyticus]|uniref:Secreted protein n=1 Tax=Streptomyces endophyticus TaxID=714166 RepID=A0ABU6F5Y4_9ACTN|nr:hypothetical protein [Streptomyces endophyticus]MEB8339427.1 hypothetical protein [Streptomyces endophyticus]
MRVKKNSHTSVALLATALSATLMTTVPAAAGTVDRATHVAPAQSAAAANPCRRDSYRKVAYTFYRGPSKVIMRCGTASWGYKHIAARGRWSGRFKNKISDTLWNGYRAAPGVVYRYKPSNSCRPRPTRNFKVVYNQGPYGGPGARVSPQGIITATVEYTTFAAMNC